MNASQHHGRTLWLAGALHGFTHIYQVALLPLYLPIQTDLALPTLGWATLLQTVMLAAYFLPSYPLGVLADRLSRKRLLAWGLFINATAYVGLAFAPNYPIAIACAVVAGLGGSFYHPAATALVARLYPVGTGRALGLVAIGASTGFFLGPLYSGWRASGAGSWRAPVFELGLFGILASGVFAWLAHDDGDTPPAAHDAQRGLFPAARVWLLFLCMSLAFSLRDFAGSSMGTLTSLFLQRARGFDLRDTGWALGAMFLAAVVSNPLFGHLSDRGRIRWTCAVMLLAAGLVASIPHTPSDWLGVSLMAYGFFFLAGYPMVEAALMESVPDAVRGRVFGLFITVGGLIGNMSHWVIGASVEALGTNAGKDTSYAGIYASLSGLMVASLGGLAALHRLRRSAQPACIHTAATASSNLPPPGGITP